MGRDFTFQHPIRDLRVTWRIDDRRMSLTAALALIQMDYMEMPGLRVTVQQGRRLWTLPLEVCQAALDTLAAAGFLARTEDGTYLHRGAAPVRIEMIDSLTWSTGQSQV